MNSTPIEGDEGAGVAVPRTPAPGELDVRICRLTFGVSTYAWLCAACRAARKAAGWSVELAKTTVLYPLHCDDCDIRRQGGPA